MAKPRRPRRIRKTLPAHVRELVSVSLPLYVRKGQEKKWKEVAQRITKLLPRPEDAYRLLVRIFVALECASIHNRRSSERRRRAGDLKQIKKWSEKNPGFAPAVVIASRDNTVPVGTVVSFRLPA